MKITEILNESRQDNSLYSYVGQTFGINFGDLDAGSKNMVKDYLAKNSIYSKEELEEILDGRQKQIRLILDSGAFWDNLAEEGVLPEKVAEVATDLCDIETTLDSLLVNLRKSL